MGSAAPIFRYLAPTVLALGMMNPLTWLMVSAGLQARTLQQTLVISPLIIAVYFIGLPYGATGVAIAYTTLMVLWTIPQMMWSIRGTNFTIGELLSALAPPAVCSASAGLLTTFAVVLPGLGEGTIVLHLVLGAAVMGVSYFILLLFVMGQKSVYSEVYGSLRSSVPNLGDART